MSTVDADLEIADIAVDADRALTLAREARVGEMTVRRLLPLRQRRSVGAWCFVDHYGPMSVDGMAGMRVPPHPHIGLQTVTWLISGNVLHRDSLGSEEIIGAEIVARRGAADWDAADWAVAGHAAGGPDASGRIAVTPSHEHVVFVSAGSADVEGTVLRTGQL